MHAHARCQPLQQSFSVPEAARAGPGPATAVTRFRQLRSPSPLGRVSLAGDVVLTAAGPARGGDERRRRLRGGGEVQRVAQRRTCPGLGSIFEPISEESAATPSLAPYPVEDLEIYKRHHIPRARPEPPQVHSTPDLISTSTTRPIHINPSVCVSLHSLLPHLLISHSAAAAMSVDSLMPKSDSFNARMRGSSHIDFKTATTGVAAKAMRNELSNLVRSVSDPETKRAFDTEMQSFFYLFTRYLSERARSHEL